MTNDEIKKALRTRCPILHRDRNQQTAITYAYAQAWRVSVDFRGDFISSLELVSGGKIRSMTIADANDCEIVEENKNGREV